MTTPVTTSYVVPSMTSTATPTSTSTSSNGSPNNSLLFFVALGFGVLFTNLWIIIGVKYCFRYQNARRRGLAMGSTGEGVAMGTVHHGRRRREKKLMTMEEVETQFPQMSYKAWRAQRERMGLSTEGGVSAVGTEDAQTARDVLRRGSTTRPASLRSVRTTRSLHTIAQVDTTDSGIYEIGSAGEVLVESKFRSSEDDHLEKPIVSPKADHSKRVSVTIDRELADQNEQQTRASLDSRRASVPLAVEEDNNEDTEVAEVDAAEAEIQHLPGDIGSGDTCAICIDQLEENDEVRGLSCGHAFHCSCVDVWLTTRRAICPLCKRDYWVRKNPAPGSTVQEATGGNGTAASARQTTPGFSFGSSGSSRVFGFGFSRGALFTRSRGTANTSRPAPSRRNTNDLEAGRAGNVQSAPNSTLSS